MKKIWENFKKRFSLLFFSTVLLIGLYNIPWEPLTPNSYNWLLALVIGLFSSLISLLLAQFTNNTRSHHTTKVFNELFGKLQISFAGFFFTIIMVVEIYKQSIPRELGLMVLLPTVFFIIGIIQIMRQDTMIKRNSHECERLKDQHLLNALREIKEDLDREDATGMNELTPKKIRLYKDHVNNIRSNACEERISIIELLDICKTNMILFVISFALSYYFITTKLSE